MPILLKEILKSSNQDIVALIMHLTGKMDELEKVSPGNELMHYVRLFWNKQVVSWYNDYYLKQTRLDLPSEEKFKDQILDWINYLNNEIRANKK